MGRVQVGEIRELARLTDVSTLMNDKTFGGSCRPLTVDTSRDWSVLGTVKDGMPNPDPLVRCFPGPR